MNDDQKLQLIRLKVEELQDDLAGRKSRRRAAAAAQDPPQAAQQTQPQAAPPAELGDGVRHTGAPFEPDGPPDDDNLVDDDFSTNLAGRRNRRLQVSGGSVQAAEGMGDVSVGVANSSMTPVLGFIGLASMGLSAYHGYRRNDSLGWGIAWGVLGAVFPVITPAIALAQGFGKPIGKTKSNAGSGDCPECGGDLGEGLGCDTCDVYVEDGVDEFLVEQAALQA